MAFLTYEQFTEAQCSSGDDPVKPWDPEIHGPLRETFFATYRGGTKWEMRTENDVPVYVEEDNQSVQNYLNLWKAEKQVREEGT